jgi:hypothetical protein
MATRTPRMHAIWLSKRTFLVIQEVRPALLSRAGRIIGVNMNTRVKPETLYHYTTLEGLLGILSQNVLWATKIQYLNDASELTKPIEIAVKMVEDMQKSSVLSVETKKSLSEGIEQLNFWREVNLCVASFCEEGDLLSQWRGYGSFGSAFSVGFKTEKIQDTISKNGFELIQCKYLDDAGYSEAVDHLFWSAVAESMKNDKTNSDFLGMFIKSIAGIKLKCFQEEKEWRIISSRPIQYDNPNFKFRTGKSMIIPYYALPLDPSSIVEIVIGPCQHPGLVKSALNGLATKYNLKNIIEIDRIKVSLIPYRVF